MDHRPLAAWLPGEPTTLNGLLYPWDLEDLFRHLPGQSNQQASAFQDWRNQAIDLFGHLEIIPLSLAPTLAFAIRNCHWRLLHAVIFSN